MRQILRFALSLPLVIFMSCNGASTGSGGSPAPSPTPTGLTIPYGAAVPGVTFGGALAGKTMYLLPNTVNFSNCWMDSVAWTGSELFFGISSLNWTQLDNGHTVYEPSCNPNPAFDAQVAPGTTGNFNLYRAEVQGSNWVLSSLPLNVGQTVSVAAGKLSGNTFVYVKYEKTASAYGNIYLSQRTGDNTYTSGVAFSQNSANCNEDNPFLYANGTQMIFESSRANPTATSCGTTQKLWSSSYDGTSWSTPVALTGTPAGMTNSVEQPWEDSTQTNLYWTGSSTDCGGTYPTCVMTAAGSGTSWPGAATAIIKPTGVGTGWYGGGMLGFVGQYTESNGYAFVTCGIVDDVDPTGGTSGLIFGRFQINFNLCVIPL